MIMKMQERPKNIKINISEIPQSEINIGCSILASSIRSLFQNPDIRAEYEAWLKSPEGQKARERS